MELQQAWVVCFINVIMVLHMGMSAAVKSSVALTSPAYIKNCLPRAAIVTSRTPAQTILDRNAVLTFIERSLSQAKRYYSLRWPEGKQMMAPYVVQVPRQLQPHLLEFARSRRSPARNTDAMAVPTEDGSFWASGRRHYIRPQSQHDEYLKREWRGAGGCVGVWACAPAAVACAASLCMLADADYRGGADPRLTDPDFCDFVVDTDSTSPGPSPSPSGPSGVTDASGETVTTDRTPASVQTEISDPY